MEYRAPKSIKNHPGVASCEYGPASGVEDYRHDVWLKDGWLFSDGRMRGCRGGHFNSVMDFHTANPTQSRRT